MTNILTIDPGLAHLGWASRVEGKVSSGTIETSLPASLHARLDALVIGVPFRHYKYLVIENCFGPAKTKLDYVIGSLIAAIDHEAYVLVSPAKWKKTLCPKGTKETYGAQITRTVRKAFGVVPDSQHSADALGLLYWFHKYGARELE